MVLSQREKYIAIALGAVLAILLAKWVVIGPLQSWGEQISQEKSNAEDQLDKDEKLRHRRVELTKVWEDMKKNGLKSDVSDAQSQLSNAVREWAEQSSVKIDRTNSESSNVVDQKTGFIQVNYQVNCLGTTSSIAKLLYQIESAKIPIRVNNIRFASLKDGADDLTVILNLSTLCVPPTSNRPSSPVVSAGQ